MRLLLDTATFLWVVSDAPELSGRARELVVDPENDVYLSAVSAWEIAVKHALGRLPLPDSPERFVPEQRKQQGIEELPLDEESALQLTRLPMLHKDPSGLPGNHASSSHFDARRVDQPISGAYCLIASVSKQNPYGKRELRRMCLRGRTRWSSKS